MTNLTLGILGRQHPRCGADVRMASKPSSQGLQDAWPVPNEVPRAIGWVQSPVAEFPSSQADEVTAADEPVSPRLRFSKSTEEAVSFKSAMSPDIPVKTVLLMALFVCALFFLTAQELSRTDMSWILRLHAERSASYLSSERGLVVSAFFAVEHFVCDALRLMHFSGERGEASFHAALRGGKYYVSEDNTTT
jgi:hypothetical protein